MVKKPVKLTMSEELYNWFFAQSEATGLSVPAIAVMACVQYKQQMEGINALKDIQALVEGVKLIPKDK